MTLFQECLRALGKKAVVLSKEETNKNFKKLTKMFPMTAWGRVDWNLVEKKIEINEISSIKEHLSNLEELDKVVILLWDEATLPAVEINLETALDKIDEVTAVSFNTWILCPDSKCLIEFYHEGNITLGVV